MCISAVHTMQPSVMLFQTALSPPCEQQLEPDGTWLLQIWRVYQRGLEQWLADLLQPTFDGLVEARSVPAFVKRLKIVEFTVDHAAPYFTNMRRRTSRKVCAKATVPWDLPTV